jgi:hypothetical protein
MFKELIYSITDNKINPNYAKHILEENYYYENIDNALSTLHITNKTK